MPSTLDLWKWKWLTLIFLGQLLIRRILPTWPWKFATYIFPGLGRASSNFSFRNKTGKERVSGSTVPVLPDTQEAEKQWRHLRKEDFLDSSQPLLTFQCGSLWWSDGSLQLSSDIRGSQSVSPQHFVMRFKTHVSLQAFKTLTHQQWKSWYPWGCFYGEGVQDLLGV